LKIKDEVEEEIDVSYAKEGEEVKTKSLNVMDDAVKDRWSRYIGAMGIEAVAKQAESVVFISGLGALGVEIAKNIVLAGCKELILHDTKLPRYEDLCGQFFLSEDDVKQDKKSRAECCKKEL